MRKVSQWVLTLGIVAATPGVTWANPFTSLFGLEREEEAATTTDRVPNRNQKVAEEIGRSLKAANLRGTGIEIQYQNGVATLTGRIADAAQKEMATRIASRVPGVQRVDNRLTASAAAPATSGGLRNSLAGAFGREPAGATGGGVRHSLAENVTGSGARHVSAEFGSSEQLFGTEDAAAFAGGNQEIAQQIANSLTRAQLNAYDIQIQFQDGVAALSGTVADPQQAQLAEQVASQVAGVRLVNNQLQVAGGAAYGQQYAAAPQGQMPYHPVNYQQQGGPAPQGFGHPGPGGAHAAYTMPNMPDYAWPAYASYPNSAQVNYPTEYSASAWPYIGPFYPYPQIPLGWRQAQLEWDDGFWNLNFHPRTDKWWWFVQPKNW